MFDPDIMRAFEELKAIWDPDDRMNPGKVVHPYRLDENLRLGAEFRPPSLSTRFRYPDDKGSFSYAMERCVGIGECRRLDGGTMCPSYMVTREEQHSTRGRARLLFEMIRGDSIRDGWKSEAVHEALDLCLSCKGCKSECPVNVDMATYKAEFLSHYYQHHTRPRAAYAFGLVYWWARLAAVFPGLANLFIRTPILSRLMKWAAGVDARRTLPVFAPVTFRQWWQPRPVRGQGRPMVLLWVDTWSNHWQPAVAIAAVEALEDAGFQVVVPRQSLCCGRPLYDPGMLDLARRMLVQILDAVRPALRAGVPIVGLEPSCISVFRDELPSFFPDRPDAKRLEQQSFMLGEFLLNHAPGWKPPRLARKALVQGHCHHKAVLDFEHQDAALFDELGLDADVLDAGCCGMAGGFGYEKAHYAVSIACGERQLAPAIRDAPDDTIIIADGFSCREQIQHQTHRRALHTAQVLQMARQQGPLGPAGPRPERGHAGVRLPVPWTRRLRNAALIAMAAGGAYAIVRARRRRQPWSRASTRSMSRRETRLPMRSRSPPSSR